MCNPWSAFFKVFKVCCLKHDGPVISWDILVAAAVRIHGNHTLLQTAVQYWSSLLPWFWGGYSEFSVWDLWRWKGFIEKKKKHKPTQPAGTDFSYNPLRSTQTCTCWKVFSSSSFRCCGVVVWISEQCSWILIPKKKKNQSLSPSHSHPEER